ncbi:MAG: hypothetical protein WDO56_35965 [Gammaproteobacteria bacterium]
MTHSMIEDELVKANEDLDDNDSIEIVHACYRYRDEPLPRARPEERITRGIRPKDFLGICAEEFDDEYMDAVLAIRRGVWPQERRS